MLNLRSRFVAITMFISCSSLVFVSCDKDDDDDVAIYTLNGNANGAQEAPNPVNTAAAGTITGTYNKSTNVLQYTITWNGLSSAPVAMHFHGPADPGVPAGVKIPIEGFTAAASGTVTQTDTIGSEADEAEFLTGKWYYNIHTPANPGGEIRGQVFSSR